VSHAKYTYFVTETDSWNVRVFRVVRAVLITKSIHIYSVSGKGGETKFRVFIL